MALERSFLQSLTLPPPIRVQSTQAGLTVEVMLSSAGTQNFAGTWTTAPGSQPLTCIQAFTEGRASYTPFLKSNWAKLALILIRGYSRIVIKTPDTLSVLGDMSFPRFKSGRAGDSYYEAVPYAEHLAKIPDNIGSGKASGRINLVSP